MTNEKDFDLFDQLQEFIKYVEDQRPLVDPPTAVDRCIVLFTRCEASRAAVLQFLSNILIEFCQYYWLDKLRHKDAPRKDSLNRFQRPPNDVIIDNRNVTEQQSAAVSQLPAPVPQSVPSTIDDQSPASPQGPASPPPTDYNSSATIKTIPTTPVKPHMRRASSNASMDIDQTPRSPSPAAAAVEISEDTISVERNVVDTFHEFEAKIFDIRSMLTSYLNLSTPARQFELVVSWAIELVSEMSCSCREVLNDLVRIQSNQSGKSHLAVEIALWLDNPASQLLVDLMLSPMGTIQQCFTQLSAHSPNTDWLLAHLLIKAAATEAHLPSSSQKLLPSCIDHMVSSQLSPASITLVLSHLHENTPKACAKPRKSFVPFVTQMYQSARSLIDSLANEIQSSSDMSFRTKHRMCLSLTTSYFTLLEHEPSAQLSVKQLKIEQGQLMDSLRKSQLCMKQLVAHSVSQHILSRQLLEFTLSNGHLFHSPGRHNSRPIDADHIEYDPLESKQKFVILYEENRKMPVGNKFRRLVNPWRINRESNKINGIHHETSEINGDKNDNSKVNSTCVPSRESINRWLMLQAFQASIVDFEPFASLFVECLAPVILDKDTWPDDESLRSITERDLRLLKMFESNPLLWDLLWLIGRAGYLTKCIVLVKTMLTAQLALWSASQSMVAASADSKLRFTSKLVTLMVKADLIPKRPFISVIELLPHLKANEIFYLLRDIYRYLRDQDMARVKNPLCTADSTLEMREYTERLRLLMCKNLPGSQYIKVFNAIPATTAHEQNPVKTIDN